MTKCRFICQEGKPDQFEWYAVKNGWYMSLIKGDHIKMGDSDFVVDKREFDEISDLLSIYLVYPEH